MDIQLEFENWVDELHEQGYDLSNFTWEGLFEYYCDEVLSEGPYEGDGPSDDAIRRAVRGGRFFTSQTAPISTAATSEMQKINQERIQSQDRLNKNPGVRGTLPGGSVVLARQGGVEGKLDKGTGLFTAGKFNKDEASRYNQVNRTEIQKGLNTYNTLRTSTKPEDQASVKAAGIDVWRRSNPTLAARLDANKARVAGTSPQQTQNISAVNYMGRNFSAPGNEQRGYQGPPTPGRTTAPVSANISSTQTTTYTPQTSMRTSNAATGSRKPGSVYGSFDFGTSNYITEDLNYLYHSIYEGSEVDQDSDGDNDGADVMIARMIASGMSKEEAIRRTRNKLYNKKGKASKEELKEFAALLPLLARGAGSLAARGAATRLAGGAASNSLRSRLAGAAGDEVGEMVSGKIMKKRAKGDDSKDSEDDSSSGTIRDFIQSLNMESVYDEILGYLIEFGYADDFGSAEIIFENLSEECQYAIIEQLQNL